MKVLLLVNNQQEEDKLNRILLSMGHSASVAPSIQATEAALKQDYPDLLIVDEGDEGKDAISFCNGLKENQLFRQLPIIYLTDEIDYSQVILGGSTEAINFVKKPYEESTIADKILNLPKLKELPPVAPDHEQLEMLKKASARLCHDINNPLCSLICNIELEMRLIKDEENSTFKRLEKLYSDAHRMQEIIQKFVTVRRNLDA